MIGRPARRRRNHPLKAQTLQIQFVDKDIDDPDGIILGHIVIETLGKQRLLLAICTLNEAAHRRMESSSTMIADNLETQGRRRTSQSSVHLPAPAGFSSDTTAGT